MKKCMQIICSAIILYVKRWGKAILWQMPWFLFFSILLWYGKHHINEYISQAFNLSVYTQNTLFWQKRLHQLYDSLSLTNPFGYADYISALSTSAIAVAKEETIRQTILILNDLLSRACTLIWVFGCFYLLIRILRSYQNQMRRSEIADAVVDRLLPLLEEIKKQK